MIIIDAGHGGKDPGAIGNNIVEKDLVLEISLYLESRFKEIGLECTLTRVEDELLPPVDRIKRIHDLIKSDENVLIISNHINAGGGSGAEIIYPLRSNGELAKKILDGFKSAKFSTRQIFQRRSEINEAVDYYYMLRNTNPYESLIIEYGYLDDNVDAYNIINYWERYAEIVIRCVCEYFNVKYCIKDNCGKEIYYNYEVLGNEDLYDIANKFKISIDRLIKVNNLNSACIKDKNILLIPAIENKNIYLVKRGDTLIDISNKFRVSTDDLMRINKLDDAKIEPDTYLYIPKVPKIITYQVQPYDSLTSIAIRYTTSIHALKELNHLESDLLEVGKTILIQI